MPNSIFDPSVQQTLDAARAQGGALFGSPEDWRDVPIYFLMLDRFNNPANPPRNLPYDASFNQFQGGTYRGVQAQLGYIKDLGFRALWLSPPLKNRPSDPTAYHGYGIQHFLAAEPRYAADPARADDELRALVDAAHGLGLYVIFDIVLHHAGDVFEYAASGASSPWQNQQLAIRWRDASGAGNPAWTDAPANPPSGAAVFPDELRRNEMFTRQGNCLDNGAQPDGDFMALKGIDFTVQPGITPASAVLIRASQYVVARFDVDAFRIDTLKFIPADFERVFGNAMREFALSAGKKNFFTFGEVYDNEETISHFIGRNTNATGDVVGVDAALDYPLFYLLPNVVKGLDNHTPAELAQVFETRKLVEESILTSHGEAGAYFVSFLDNHDQPQRFGFTGAVQFADQIVLGLACLCSLQGVPCVYYGTEQGLSGHKDATHGDDSMVREALWGKPGGGFDASHPIYAGLQQILRVRREQPALRYGRQYFRPLSGDGSNFGLSSYPNGVIAFSRILNDQEVVFIANTNRGQGFDGEVIVDQTLHAAATSLKVLFSNQRPAAPLAGAVLQKSGGTLTIHEVDGATTNGPATTVQVHLQPGEVQIFA